MTTKPEREESKMTEKTGEEVKRGGATSDVLQYVAEKGKEEADKLVEVLNTLLALQRVLKALGAEYSAVGSLGILVEDGKYKEQTLAVRKIQFTDDGIVIWGIGEKDKPTRVGGTLRNISVE